MGVLMAFFRVHVPLDRGKGRIVHTDSLTQLAWLNEEDQIRLVQCGAVSRVAPPPLRILPGWKTRGERLAPHDIITVVDFLEADNALLQDILVRRKEATIIGWKTLLEQQLVARPQKG